MTKWSDFVKMAQEELLPVPASYSVALMPDSKLKREVIAHDNPDTGYGLAKRLGNVDFNIGVMKGLKEAVPGFIDFLIGNTSGAINGVKGLIKGEPFHKGFYESKNFAKKYYSDPIRNAEMAIGGRFLRDMTYEQRENILSKLREGAGNDPAKQEQISDVDRWSGYLGNGMEVYTGLFTGIPTYNALASKGATFGTMAANKIYNAMKPLKMNRLEPWARRAGVFIDSGLVASEGGARASLGRDEYGKAERELKEKFNMTPDEAMAALRRKYASGFGSPEWRQRVKDRFPDADSWK